MFGSTKAYSSFAVDDARKARAFYEETLGLKTTMLDEENGIMTVRLGGGSDVLVYERPGHEPAAYTVLNFSVDDVEAAVDGLTERGVTFERYEGIEQDEKGIARGMGPTIAWFTDPAGNVFAVLQE